MIKMEYPAVTEKRDVVILGSTGSVGSQAVEVIKKNPDRFNVVGLAAGGARVAQLAEQVLDFNPMVVAVADERAAGPLTDALSSAAAKRGLRLSDWPKPKILRGASGVEEAAAWPAHVVLNGITGALGLRSTLAVLRAGTTLALANKESLIVGGRLVTEAAAPGQIVPVDSEHSAIAQAMRGGSRQEVRRLVITANGGPFRGRRRHELTSVTPAQALKHPKWDMGPVITINSATLVNKALEVIEAHLLYAVPYQDIEVVVHPQSVVHSMVEFYDGSTIAQASPPDMRLPIALGLAWPNRIPGAVPAVNWTASHAWEFLPLDNDTFPAIELGRQAGCIGGSSPAVYNAANEVCVDAFLAGRLPFLAIMDTVARVLSEHDGRHDCTLESIMAADSWARTRAKELNADAFC